MKRQSYELQQKQPLPLELKIIMTQRSIRNWLFGGGGSVLFAK